MNVGNTNNLRDMVNYGGSGGNQMQLSHYGGTRGRETGNNSIVFGPGGNSPVNYDSAALDRIKNGLQNGTQMRLNYHLSGKMSANG